MPFTTLKSATARELLALVSMSRGQNVRFWHNYCYKNQNYIQIKNTVEQGREGRRAKENFMRRRNAKSKLALGRSEINIIVGRNHAIRRWTIMSGHSGEFLRSQGRGVLFQHVNTHKKAAKALNKQISLMSLQGVGGFNVRLWMSLRIWKVKGGSRKSS